MDEYKRRRRRSRAVMSMFLDSLGGSIDNVDVATFDNDGSDLKALVVGIEPIQDLHGYDNPWPAGGGVNKFYRSSNNSVTWNGMTCSFDASTQTFTINGTNESSSAYVLLDVAPTADVPRNIALCRAFIGAPTGIYINLVYTDGSWHGVNNGETIPDTVSIENVRIQVGVLGNVGSIPTTTFKCQLEEGSTKPTAWSPYSNICPITGHSSVNVIVSPTLNPLDGTITNIPLGSTYYGGQLDVLTGVLTVTHANISSYNGEAINEPWISSMDAYSPGATPTTGAQVVYPLSTPTTTQLTGQQIATFLGTNNVWCDSGKIIHLEY